jgi:hypothetical protein
MGQHYVARFYLRAWATNGKLQCLNRTTGRIRECGLRGIAHEPLFYQLHDLTPEEIEWLERTLIEPCAEPLKSFHRRFLWLYTLTPKLKAHTANKQSDPRIRAVLDDQTANAIERIHSRIETGLQPFVASMLDGDTSFYADAKKAGEFIYAICVQFTRTKRLKQTLIEQMGTKYKGCDARRLCDAVSHIIATSAGQSLFIDRHNFKIVLLDNNTDTPFITADQPIINLHARLTGEAPDKLEYFYPLSPRKAMLFLEASNGDGAGETSVSALAVNNYNVLMLKNSFEQVYSNSADYLEVIKKL